MRRLVVIAGAVVLAGALVLLVAAPRHRSGEEAVSGPRVVRMAPASVERVVVTIGERRATAERVDGRWTSEGRPVSAGFEDALTDLLSTLATLRAVDRFRPRDGASFGLEPSPRATIELTSSARSTRILLGELNGSRSAVYARREGAPQVWLVGLYLISALERVIYFAGLEPAAPGA